MRFLSCASINHLMNEITRLELPIDVRQLTSDDLRRVKVEAQRIDALALIGLLTTTSKSWGKEEDLGELPHQVPTTKRPSFKLPLQPEIAQSCINHRGRILSNPDVQWRKPFNRCCEDLRCGRHTCSGLQACCGSIVRASVFGLSKGATDRGQGIGGMSWCNITC